MNPLKPDKKTNVIIIISILLLGACFIGWVIFGGRTSRADFLEQLTREIKDQELSNDSDHDGLENWEEEVYGTLPDNQDTDNDGYLDGEEVAAGYDPTKPAPNDKIIQVEGDDTTQDRQRPERGNLTQLLAYLLADQIQTGQMPRLDNVQDVTLLEDHLKEAIDAKVVEAMRKASAGFTFEFVPIFQKDNHNFVTIPGDTLAAIHQYAGELSQKLEKMDACQHPYNPDGIKDESEVIRRAIESKNFERVNCLSKSYKQAYNETMQVSVPLEWVDIHKNFLTIFWTLHKVHQHIPQLESDPLKGAIVFKKFEQINERLSKLLETIQIDLEERQQ